MVGFLRRSTVILLALASLTVALPAVGQPNAGPPDISGGSLFGSASAEAKKVVAVQAQFTASTADAPARLYVTATIAPGWHIYSITQPPGGPITTKIEVNPSPDFRLSGEFHPSVPPDAKKDPVFDNLMVETHHGTVIWSRPLELTPGVDPAKLAIQGKITFQACDANSCLPPTPKDFTATLTDRTRLPNVVLPAAGTGQEVPATAQAVFDPSALQIAENDELQKTSMGLVLAMGFLGGLILNLMPCVLPVIGLKILSFLEQSGHSRGHAFALNIWYSLGMLSVFLVLATLAVTLGLGWGQLFSYPAFNVTLAAVVFVMGLSFLGVWEISIPGFVGRGKAVELAEKEGFAGAFSKGILTTILATPCSAPFLASALTWAVSQPPAKTYAVFTAVGLGMASPYLLIGAFPSLLGFLPKPGQWMDTFKQVMGFVLLGTVVFVLTFIPLALVIPTVGFLFGLWAACWWIGRTSLTADLGTKAGAWLTAATIATAVGMVTFGWLSGVMQGYFDRAVEQAIANQMIGVQVENGAVVTTVKPMLTKNGKHLPWQPFTPRVLQEAVASGATVMVDFTADWCLTCKTLEATVLSSQEVRDTVQASRIVTLRADWTHGQPEVTKMLKLLGSKQVPVLAIFPAGRANTPVVMRGFYTPQALLDVLKAAGPSKQP